MIHLVGFGGNNNRYDIIADSIKKEEIFTIKDLFYVMIKYFLYVCFLFGCVLCMIFYEIGMLSYIESSLIMIGIVMISSFYTINYVSIIQKLTDQVNQYEILNIKFHKENKKLINDINQLSNIKSSLSNTKDRISLCIEQNKINLQKYVELNRNIKTIFNEYDYNISRYTHQSNYVLRRWREQRIKEERRLLTVAFESFMHKHQCYDGLTKDIFDKLVDILPESYQNRLNKIKIFDDDTSIINIDSFCVILDKFSEMEVDGLELNHKISLKTLMKSTNDNQNNNDNDIETEFSDDNIISSNKSDNIISVSKLLKKLSKSLKTNKLNFQLPELGRINAKLFMRKTGKLAHGVIQYPIKFVGKTYQKTKTHTIKCCEYILRFLCPCLMSHEQPIWQSISD